MRKREHRPEAGHVPVHFTDLTLGVIDADGLRVLAGQFEPFVFACAIRATDEIQFQMADGQSSAWGSGSHPPDLDDGLSGHGSEAHYVAAWPARRCDDCYGDHGGVDHGVR